MTRIRRFTLVLCLVLAALISPMVGLASAGEIGGQFCSDENANNGATITHNGTTYTCQFDDKAYNRWLPS